mgnify:CR=1 FL=1
MGGGGGDSGNSEYYQAQQLDIARQQLELQKAQVTEPEKRVDGAKQAKTDALKEQELRRGLASAFSRGGVGLKSASGGSATGGAAGKLGD